MMRAISITRYISHMHQRVENDVSNVIFLTAHGARAARDVQTPGCRYLRCLPHHTR